MLRRHGAPTALVKPWNADNKFSRKPSRSTNRYGRKGPTFGLHDHTAGVEWSGKPGIRMRQGYACDEEWFLAHSNRRIYIRLAFPGELAFGEGRMGWWVAVLRSKHDIMWNRAAFPFFLSPLPLWDEPSTDDEALAIVGRFDPRAMLSVALLAINCRFLPDIGRHFSGFDLGAGERPW